MLPRVLEPEAMDTPEEAREYDAMDHRSVNGRFVADFLEAHGPCRGGEILDVGTGTARIPIALCSADANAHVLAIDLARSMLEQALRNLAEAGLSSRIRCALADAKALGFSNGTFEAVFSNSIVHHLPNPAPVLAEMARLVAPGGTLFVRDLTRPRDLPELSHLVETYAGTETQAARALFEASLNAALTIEEVRDIVRAIGLPDEGVMMTSDRHWTWIWQNPVAGRTMDEPV
jgi:ubiquinone/menaquinone biosynthesis C-methylase UbiE